MKLLPWVRCLLYTLWLTDLDWIIKLLVLWWHPVDAKSVNYSDHCRCMSCQSSLFIYLFSHVFIDYNFFRSPLAPRDVELVCLQCETLVQDERLVLCAECVDGTYGQSFSSNGTIQGLPFHVNTSTHPCHKWFPFHWCWTLRTEEI